MLTVEGKKFDWKNIPLIQCVEGNAKDTYATAKVYAKLLEEVRQKKLEKLYDKLIAPLTIAFRDMEFEGLLIDEDKMNELDQQLQEKIKLADIALRAAAGLEEDANLNSTNQLVKIIYSFEKNDDGEWIQVDDFGLGLVSFRVH
jgi:DNA polymerase I-like protein with 3'-5' exonuclease and polymerase domains